MLRTLLSKQIYLLLWRKTKGTILLLSHGGPIATVVHISLNGFKLLFQLDRRIKLILNIIQDGGDTFARRAENFYNRRPELIKLVQDLYRSYCSLARKYDQIISEGFHAAHLIRSSSCPASSSNQQFNPLKDSDKENVLEAQTVGSVPYPAAQEHPFLKTAAAAESMSSKQNTDVLGNHTAEEGHDEMMAKYVELDETMSGDFLMESLERERMRDELRLEVSRLIEDNLRQQKELVRRNEEKKETIRQLNSQVNRLLKENKILRSYLSGYKEENLPGCKVEMKRSQSAIARLKGLNCIGKSQG
ncbi:hypothetical protein Tsubulata_015757 [Turnera subulata]|uniref:NAB domain-containing protein n=1 Tax=Turnera subulata TaxID=218843 RepID=A0A9Q0GBB6_9ROSI|nr:hypothetical protein Tsubulata_015757 [Turnera subulata]